MRLEALRSGQEVRFGKQQLTGRRGRLRRLRYGASQSCSNGTMTDWRSDRLVRSMLFRTSRTLISALGLQWPLVIGSDGGRRLEEEGGEKREEGEGEGGGREEAERRPAEMLLLGAEEEQGLAMGEDRE